MLANTITVSATEPLVIHILRPLMLQSKSSLPSFHRGWIVSDVGLGQPEAAEQFTGSQRCFCSSDSFSGSLTSPASLALRPLTRYWSQWSPVLHRPGSSARLSYYYYIYYIRLRGSACLAA